MKKFLKSLVSVLSVIVLTAAIFVPAFQASAAALALNKTSIILVVGQTYALKFNKTVKKAVWTSSDKKVVTVSKTGVVNGIKKGSAVVAAKVGKKTYKCKVAVEAPKLSLSKKSVKAGTSFALKLNGTKRTAKWYTSNKKIATVSAKGVVKALKTGKVNITAKLGGKSYVCKVTVTKASSGKLTKAQIIRYLQNGDNLYDGWLCHGWDITFDNNDKIIHNNSTYRRVVNSRFSSVSELEKELKKYFSKETYQERLDSYYCMYNGKMYASEGFGQGGDVSPVKLKLTVSKSTTNYCKFIVTSYYDIAYEPLDSVYEMKKVNGRWIFINNFECALGAYNNKNIKWI